MYKRTRATNDPASLHVDAASPQASPATAHDPNAEDLRRLSGEPALLTLKLDGIVVGNYYYQWDLVPIDIRSDMVQAYNEKYRER